MIGTPGFVGARLTEGREARALPASVLAELVGVSHAAILQYESGKTSPRPEVMALLADRLNLPQAFFKRPLDSLDESEDGIVWRSLTSATKAARRRCWRRLTWVQNIVRYLRESLDLPEPKLPDFGIGNPALLTMKDIEVFASLTRETWGLGVGPIADLTLLLENNGVIVSRLRLTADGLDAFARWSERDGAPYIILGADKNSAVRSRYDAAHEFGHLVLHRKTAGLDHKRLEAQAFRFASALLLPEQSFVKELWAPSLDAFRSLKDRWRVSIGAMIKRCEQLEILGSEQTQRMWINYNRRGWRQVEPLDEVLPIERPRLLGRCFEMLVRDGIRSKAQILVDLPYAARDLEEIARLPKGYFIDEGPEVRLKDSGTARPAGSVVPFPGGRPKN